MKITSIKAIKFMLFGFYGITYFAFQAQAQDSRFSLPQNFKLHIFEKNNTEYGHSVWLKGDLIYSNNSRKSYDSIRFNNISNELEIITNNRPLSLLPGIVNAFIIKEGEQLGHLYIVEEIDGLKKYLEVLSVGKQVLLSLVGTSEPNKTPIDKEKMNEIRFEKQEKPIIKFVEAYYVFNKNGLQKLKTSEKAILKTTSFSKEKMNLFIKKENILLKKREGIAMLFNYINGQ